MERRPGDPYKLDEAEIAHFAEHFDHHDERFGLDPYPVYQAMREKGPLTWSDNYDGFWVATGYDVAHHIWGSHELFSSSCVSLPGNFGVPQLVPLEVDPPLHARYRNPLTTPMSPGSLARFEPTIRAVCDDLIDKFIDRGECEFIAELAEPLATNAFMQLFGLPVDEVGQFVDWKNRIMHSGHKDPEGQMRAAIAVRGRLQEVIEERREQPGGDDCITALMTAEPEGGPLTDEEIVDVANLHFLAGLDTVQSALGFQFAFLARNLEYRDRLVKEPEVIPAAIEEMLRYEGLITTRRTARQDVEVAGVQIKEGCPIMIPNRAVNYDPVHFPNPDLVDFDRENKRHMTFGVGPHRCQGSHLARLEIRIVYEQMHTRIPNYRLNDGVFLKTLPSMAAGIEAVPLVWS